MELSVRNRGCVTQQSKNLSENKNTKDGPGKARRGGEIERNRSRNNWGKYNVGSIGSTHHQRSRIRRWLSKRPSKNVFIMIPLLIISIVFMIFFRVWDHFYHRIGDFGDDSSSLSPSSFAIVINTFRRPERLKQTVRYYAETCGRRSNIGQIFVVWADPETDPPQPGVFFFENNTSSSSLRREGDTIGRVPVDILVKSKDSLNARFEPIPQLQTTSVFMVDDDVRVDCSSLQMAFQAWKKHPDSMVGFYPRLAAPATTWLRTRSNSLMDQQQLVYHAWPKVYWRQQFNIVLTKASFFHSKYLELYTNDASFPKEIKDLVDKYRNCEDIAMSMLIANYTRHSNHGKDSNTITKTRKIAPARPIYVEGQISDVGLFGGISSGTGHFATRTDCLNELTSIFRSQGFGSPLEEKFDLVASSWIRHAPGFWWQSSPSNIFEWFCFTNLFS